MTTRPTLSPETNALDALQAQADATAAEFARRFDNGEFVWNDDDTLTVVKP